MTLKTNKILKVVCLISSLVSSIMWIAFFIGFFRGNNELQKSDYLFQNPNIVTYPLLCIFSIVILVKANANKGILLFSLFLSLISQNNALSYLYFQYPDFEIEIVMAISFILTSTIYIKSLQNFPQQISIKDIDIVFPKNKVLRIYLKAFLKNQTWIVFAVAVVILSSLFPGNILMRTIVLTVVLATALPFLYVNFKISSPSGRNKIRWLFWGLLCYTFITFLNSILTYSTPEIHQNISTLFKILRALSLFVSFTMCLFFFDTFDTGVIIRRTIVDGIIFIAIIFLYNTVEHYFLHWITHKLHISDTLVSSVLSGFFVLIFSPVHHKFMRVLDGKFKRKEVA